MITDALLQQLEGIADLTVRTGEPMRRHTIYRVGGPAELWLVAETEEAAAEAVRACREADHKVRWWDSGARIVRDGGLEGIWLCIGRAAEGLTPAEDCVRVGANFPAAALGAWCVRSGRAGAEGAFGRAGTVAEAWRDGALTDCVRRVRVLRGARLSTQAPDKVSATAMPIWLELELGEAKPEALRREEVRRIRARQRAGEGLPGRIFADLKRLPAGEIVSDAGLCGVRLRQARIGHKEPNNIINLGGATARDLSLLVQLVRDRVKRVSGVEIKTLHNPIGHG